MHFQQYLEYQTERIVSAQVIARAIIDSRKMGKLAEVAQRIAATKRHLELQADGLAKELDELDAKAPAAFDHGHAIIGQHRTDLEEMVSELKQLSNLPLDKSPTA